VEIAITPDASSASIAVTDHGAGIPKSEHEKIFDRFYRGRQDDTEGSGLGLAIVARVAARWNGIVALTSVPGNTMFKLQFPLADEVPA
jgi:two-component system OmpR family sensor kinase